MFFEVQAKCGHVGRYKYVVIKFYIETDTAKDAATIIRRVPRVKHNHKDAIIGVKKIGYQEYVDGIKQNEEDDYFHIHNSSDQKRIAMDDIIDEVCYEQERTREIGFKIRKWKLLEIEAKKMILGAYYG